MKLSNRLNKHFAACAAVAAATVAVAPQQADAAIVYSGTVNLNIASTTNGLYLNVETGAYNTTGGGGGTVAGWDVNPWSSTTLNYFNPAAPAGGVYVQRTGGGATANLALGTLIGGGSTYGNLGAQTTGAEAHVLNGADNYIGFRFNAADGLTRYGWMRITLGSTLSAQPRTLVDYAYESDVGVGILAGAGVPAPGAFALLGLAGLVGSRRRRA